MSAGLLSHRGALPPLVPPGGNDFVRLDLAALACQAGCSSNLFHRDMVNPSLLRECSSIDEDKKKIETTLIYAT